MRALNHVHTLVKYDNSHRKCADKYCGFICDNAWAYRKATICGVCGIKELIMDSIQMKLARPRCESCSNRREDREKRTLVQKLERLGLS